MWDSRDHHPIYARIQEGKSAENYAGRRRTKKWTGWRPRTDEQKIEFKKKVVENGEDKIDENCATIQKYLEIAAGKVAHHMKAERDKHYTKHAGECEIARGSCCKMHEKDQEYSA